MNQLPTLTLFRYDRLPVYLVLDTCGGLDPARRARLHEGIHRLLAVMRQDPTALDYIFTSVLTASSRARQVTPLTEPTRFLAPELQGHGVLALGDALREVTACREREVRTSTPSGRSDCRPFVFFVLTGRQPADDVMAGLEVFTTQKWGRVTCIAPEDADLGPLSSITDHVFAYADHDGPGSVSQVLVDAFVSVFNQAFSTPVFASTQLRTST